MSYPNGTGFDYEGLATPGTNIDFYIERHGHVLMHEDKRATQVIEHGQWMVFKDHLKRATNQLLLIAYRPTSKRKVACLWYFDGDRAYCYRAKNADDGRYMLDQLQILWRKRADDRCSPSHVDMIDLGFHQSTGRSPMTESGLSISL